MPIRAPAPLPSPYVDYDYRHTTDFNDDTHFLPPAHLVKRGPTRGVDPSMVPRVDIDTSFDEADILAREPIPTTRPLFLGIRKMLAARAIERGNDQLHDLARQHQVARHVGHSLLAGESYMGARDPNRPGSREELETARKLGKIHNHRRRAGAQVWQGHRSSTPPAVASRLEEKDANRNAKLHRHGAARISKLDDEFRATITRPAEKAARIAAKRDKAVARNEALQQAIDRRDARRQRRIEKLREMRDEVRGSSKALGEEIIERHQDSWDMTKEQAIRVGTVAAKAGNLIVDETVATAQTANKGGRYTARFYAEIGRGAADIYWQAAKRAALGTARGARKLYKSVRSKK